MIEKDSITFLIDPRFSFFTLKSCDSTTLWLQDDSLAQWYEKKDIFDVMREREREGDLLKWNEYSFIDKFLNIEFLSVYIMLITNVGHLPIYNEIPCMSSNLKLTN